LERCAATALSFSAVLTAKMSSSLSSAAQRDAGHGGGREHTRCSNLQVGDKKAQCKILRHVQRFRVVRSGDGRSRFRPRLSQGVPFI